MQHGKAWDMKKGYGLVVGTREMLHRVTGAQKWAGSQGTGEINGDGPMKNPGKCEGLSRRIWLELAGVTEGFQKGNDTILPIS